MDKKIFEEKVKPILLYVGLIGAIITSIAYIILVLVLIKGFQYQQTSQTIVFALANAAVGMIIASFLKYQGVSFAKELPENQEVVKKYYASKTKNKKNHSLQYFWIVTTVKDIIFKGLTVTASTLGLIYIVIVGSNDWGLLMMAISFGIMQMRETEKRWTEDLQEYAEYVRTHSNESGTVLNNDKQIKGVLNNDNC